MLDIKEIKEKISKVNKEIYASHPETISVSKCLGFIKEEFDKDKKAKEQFEKHFNDPNSIYYQKTTEDILNMWEEKSSTSKKYGSLLDDYIGMRLNNEDKKLALWKLDNNFDYDERLNNICTGFDQFKQLIDTKTDLQYVTREITMYISSNDKHNMIKGRFDCMFYSPSLDKVLIVDWKNTEKIESKSNFGKFFKGPCAEMSECNHSEYTIQTHFYKKAVVETYGITNYDHVDCYICQMTRKPLENGKNFKLYQQNFNFNNELLNRIINFSTEKNKLLSEI